MVRAELRLYEVSCIEWEVAPLLPSSRVLVEVDADSDDDWPALAILNAEEVFGGKIAYADTNRVV